MAGVDNNAAAAAAAAAAAKRAAEEAAKRAAAAAAKAAAAAAAKKAAASAAAKVQAHPNTAKTAPLQHQTATSGLKDANHASGTSNQEHGAVGAIAGAFGAVENAVGKAIHAVEPPKPISAKEANQQLTHLQSQFHAAKTPKEVAAVAQQASDLKSRMWATDHLAHGKENLGLRQGVDQLTTASNRANDALQQLGSLHAQMSGSAHDRATATASLLAHPNTMKSTIKNLQDVPPGLQSHAEAIATHIAAKATPEALGKQLAKDPNLSNYGPDMTKSLATLRAVPDKTLQHGIDAVGKNLLAQSTAANAPAPVAKGSGIFGAVTSALSDVAQAATKPADPLTLQAMKANPALAQIVVPAAAQSPQAAQQLQSAVDRMGSQALVQNLDANNKPPQAQGGGIFGGVTSAVNGVEAAVSGQPAPGTPQANAANSIQGFQNTMVGLARAGIPPAMVQSAMGSATTGAAETLLNRGVNMTQVKQNPAYGQVLASVQNDPQFAGRVQSQVQSWAKTSIEQHLQGKEKQSGVDDAENELKGDMIGIAKSTGLAGPAMTNGIKGALADKGVQSDIKDTANKGKSFWDSIGDVVGGLVSDATHIAGDVAGAVGNVATGHLGSAFDDIGKAGGDTLALGGDSLGAAAKLAGAAGSLGLRGLGGLAGGALDAVGAHGVANTVRSDATAVAKLDQSSMDGLGQIAQSTGHKMGADFSGAVGAAMNGHIGTAFTDAAHFAGDGIDGVGQGANAVVHDAGKAFALQARFAGQAGAGLLGAVGANGAARMFQNGANAVGKFGQGVFNGVGDSVQGLTSSASMMIEHPLQTGKGLAYVVTHPSALKAVWDQAKQGGISHAIGEIGGNLAAAILTGGSGLTTDIVSGGLRAATGAAVKFAAQDGAEGAAEGGAEAALEGGAESAAEAGGKSAATIAGRNAEDVVTKGTFAARGLEKALGAAHFVADVTGGSSALTEGLSAAKTIVGGLRSGAEDAGKGIIGGGAKEAAEAGAGSAAKEGAEAGAETGAKTGVRAASKGARNAIHQALANHKQNNLTGEAEGASSLLPKALRKSGSDAGEKPSPVAAAKARLKNVTKAKDGVKGAAKDEKNSWQAAQGMAGIARNYWKAGKHEQAVESLIYAGKGVLGTRAARIAMTSALLGLRFTNAPDSEVLGGGAENALDKAFGKSEVVETVNKNGLTKQTIAQDQNDQNDPGADQSILQSVF